MFINIKCSYTYWNPKKWNWFRYETFYYLLEFKVFRQVERETQFFSMLAFPSEPHHVRHPCHKLLVWPRRAPKIDFPCLSPNLNSLVRSQISTVFFSNSKILSASRHDVIHDPGPIPYLGFLLWHLWLSRPPRVRVNTCSECVHLTNPCTEPKGSQPH